MSTKLKLEDNFKNPEYSPEETEFMKLLYDRYQAMDKYRSNFIPQWQRWSSVFDGMMSQLDQTNLTGSLYNMLISGGTLQDDNIQPIYVRMVTAQCLLMLSEVSEKPPTVVLTALQNKDKAKTEVARIVYEYNERQNDEAYKFILRMLGSIIYGTQWTYDYYRCDKRKVKIPVNYNEKTKKYEYLEVNKTDKEGVTWQDMALKDVWVDENATDIADAEDAFMELTFSYSQFLARFKNAGFKNVECVRPMKDTSNSDGWNFIYNKEGDNNVGVKLYYNQLKDIFTVIANNVLLTEIDRPIPFRHKWIPLSHLRHIPRSKACLYWQGISELMDGLAKEYNILENMKLENLHNAIDSMTIWDSEVLIDEEDYRNRAGGMAKVNVPSGKRLGDVYRPLIKPEPGMATENEQNRIKNGVAEITGIDNKLTSSIGTPQQTATQTAAQMESLLKRVRLILKLSMPSLIRRAKMVLSNIQQFMTTSLVEQIVEDDKIVEYKNETRTIKLEGKEIKRISTEDRIKSLLEEKKKAGDTPGLTEEESSDQMSMGDSFEVSDIDGTSFFELKPSDVLGQYDVDIQFEGIFSMNKQMKLTQVMQGLNLLAADPMTAQLVDPQAKADYVSEQFEMPDELIKDQPPVTQAPMAQEGGGMPGEGGEMPEPNLGGTPQPIPGAPQNNAQPA